jgi:hypothetical protein
MDNRNVAIGLAGIRIGVGAALVVAPVFAGRIWVGPGPEGAGSKVFARALGARDVVLGYRTLRAALDGDEVGGWLQIGAMADAADSVAAAVAFAGITGHRRYTMPLVSTAMGALCFWAAHQSSGTAQDAAGEVDPGGVHSNGSARASGDPALAG